MSLTHLFRLSLASVVAFGMISGSALAGSPVFDVDREFYPYYPSLIKWNKSNAAFTPPSVCKDCHEKQYTEWSGSVHNLAFRDPVYQGELNKAVKAVGHDITRQCEGCHSPAGMVTGEIKGPGNSGLGEMALVGVSCDICHSISGVTHWQTPSHEPENGSFILTPGIDTKDGPQLLKRGPLNHRSPRPSLDHQGNKVVAVKTIALNGNKKLALTNGPGVYGYPFDLQLRHLSQDLR